MDSLLSNAQRCARKAEALLNYGLYDESLTQLEKSIAHLNELKSVTTCYESIQLVNAQLESIDRKMRSVAIKRAESIKKRMQLESLKSRRESTSSVAVVAAKSGGSKSGGVKLDKDSKSLVEELSQTNAEYKKVNAYLLDEIDQLRRENEYLKQELLKHVMTASSTSSTSSSLRSSRSSIIIDTAVATSSSSVNQSGCMNMSTTSSSGVVPQQQSTPIQQHHHHNQHHQQQQQQHQQQKQANAVAMPPMPITSVLESNDRDDDDDDQHVCRDDHLNVNNNKHPPIDLSRYINEEDDDDESGYNECSSSSGGGGGGVSGVYSEPPSFLVDVDSVKPAAKAAAPLDHQVASSSSSTSTAKTTSV